MSNNVPFLFGAGGGVPLPPAQQQTQRNQPPPTSVSASQSMTNGQPPSQGPQRQHMAFTQNSQLPTIDLSVLKDIRPDQLAIIAQLVQAGQFPLPPPAPSAPAPAQATAVTPQSNSTDPPPVLSVQEDGMDIDKEEGEVDEGEVDNTPGERGFLRLPPTGPRNRNRSSSPWGKPIKEASLRRVSSQNLRGSPPPSAGEQANGRRPSHQQTGGRGDRYVPSPHRQAGKRAMASSPSSQPPPKRATNGQRRVSKPEAAREFVLEMHRNGYKFEQLAQDLDDAKPLRRIFKELGLPVPSETPASGDMPRNNGTSTSQSAKLSSTDNLSHVTTPAETRNPSATKRPPPPKPVAPASRAEYLAKLKAAVAKPGATASALTSALPAVVAAAAAEPIEKPPAKPNELVAQSEPQPKARSAGVAMNAEKTELVRKRLAELKAQDAARNNDASALGTSPASSSPALGQTPAQTMTQAGAPVPNSTRPGAGITDIETEASVQQSALFRQPSPMTPAMPPHPPVPAPFQKSFPPPAPPTPIRTFTGLPGLGALPGLSMSGSPFNPRPAPFTESTFAPPPQPAPAPEVRRINKPKQAALQTTATQSTAASVFASPAASPAHLQVPRKRPVASDFDEPPLSVGHGPFGQTRHDSSDERLVINVSEDEDDDESDDGTDLDAHAPTTDRTTEQKSVRDMGPLRGFPSRPNFQRQTGTSVMGTPGGSTPGGTALAQREAEIQAAKRKLAELEQRRLAKLSGKATPVPRPVTTPIAGTSPVVSLGKATPVASATTSTSGIAAAGDIVNASVTEQAASSTDDTLRRATEVSVRSVSDARKQMRVREREDLMHRMLELEEEVSGAEGAVKFPGATVPATHSVQMKRPSNDTERAESGEPELDVKAGEITKREPDGEQRRINDGDSACQSNLTPNDHVKVGSQATTASPTSAAEARPNDTATLVTADSQDQYVQEGDPDMADVYEPGVSPVQDQEMKDMTGGLPQEHGGSIELGARGSDSGMVEENEMGLDEVDDGTDYAESSSASSLRSEEYEPQPDIGSLEASQPVSSAELDEAMLPVSNVGRRENPAIEDDLAPELPPPAEQQLAVSDQVDEKPRKRNTYFTAYQSPLTAFKDYIYHPHYLDTVSGGFKSLTYSHNIDPEMALCRYEADGGRCNDATCDYQHFRDMALTDHKLLTVMGSARTPAHTPDEDKRWKEGLGAVVKRLRSTNQGKDVSAIAAHIAEFRREFVGDETKVIDLDRYTS